MCVWQCLKEITFFGSAGQLVVGVVTSGVASLSPPVASSHCGSDLQNWPDSVVKPSSIVLFLTPTQTHAHTHIHMSLATTLSPVGSPCCLALPLRLPLVFCLLFFMLTLFILFQEGIFIRVSCLQHIKLCYTQLYFLFR